MFHLRTARIVLDGPQEREVTCAHHRVGRVYYRYSGPHLPTASPWVLTLVPLVSGCT